jgi:hypothetical protein
MWILTHCTQHRISYPPHNSLYFPSWNTGEVAIKFALGWSVLKNTKDKTLKSSHFSVAMLPLSMSVSVCLSTLCLEFPAYHCFLPSNFSSYIIAICSVYLPHQNWHANMMKCIDTYCATSRVTSFYKYAQRFVPCKFVVKGYNSNNYFLCCNKII